MQFATRTFVALAALASVTAAWASPVAEGAPAAASDAQAVARSMLGSTNNIVGWSSQPMERSPSDPDADSAAAELQKRIVYNPPVTTPSSNTVWHAGRTETVRWTVDQDDIPANAKNYEGTIKLGYLSKEDKDGGYHLYWTLASNFPITDGEADVTLPADLEPRDDYIIVLLGDSGNRSKKFTIKNSKSHTHPHPAEGSQEQQQQQQQKERAAAAPGIIGRDVQA